MLGFLPTRAYRPGTPGATTFLSPLSGTFNYGWDSFVLADLCARGVGGMVLGNIHLADVRAWYEERITGVGLAHVEPLWGERPPELARELLGLGYRPTIVSVDLEQGDPAWVGRELDLELLEAIEHFGADACGERGEYHTFVSDGPAFLQPVTFRTGETVTMKGHCLIDLLPV